MDKLTPTIIVIAFVAVVFLFMWRGWKARARRQNDYSAPQAVPEVIGEDLVAPLALYLSTTPSGQPMERLVVPRLGFRAQSLIEVTESGIVLRLTGENAIFIPSRDILGVAPATITIDRVVEKGGLVSLSWLLGGRAVDSYFRLASESDRQPLFDTVRRIAPPSPASAA